MDDANDFNQNLSIINSSNTRIKRLNTMSQGFSQLTYSTKKTDMDVEFNFNIKKFLIRIENKFDRVHEQNRTLMFVIKELSTQVILENKGFQDVAVDMSVQTLQIKEENPVSSAAESASANEPDNKDIDSCEIFRKIVSSPIDDYISITKMHATKTKKANKGSSTQQEPTQLGSSSQQAFYQKRLESELQLQV